MRFLPTLDLLRTGLAYARSDSACMPVLSDAPTWPGRQQVFFKKLFGPQAILETVPGTAFDTTRGFPRHWDRGGTGIARRFGSQSGQFVTGEGIGMGVSAPHKKDPRYFRMPDAYFGRRLGHALASTVVVWGASRNPTIGLARLADVSGAWAIATSWNPPDQRNPTHIANYGTLGLSLKAASKGFRKLVRCQAQVGRPLRHV